MWLVVIAFTGIGFLHFIFDILPNIVKIITNN